MACMTACPSGVQYDRLIEAARAWTDDPAHAPAVNAGPGTAVIHGVAGADGPEVASGGHVTADAAGGTLRAGSCERRIIFFLKKKKKASGRDSCGRDSCGRDSCGRDSCGRGVAPAVAGPGRRAAIFAVFPYPRRLRALAAPLRILQRTGLDRVVARSGLPGRVSPVLGAAMNLAPRPSASCRLSGCPSGCPRGDAARGGGDAHRLRAVRLLPEVNIATARVLAAEGCDVVIPRGQACCGALSLHSGRAGEAAGFARHAIETFERRAWKRSW